MVKITGRDRHIVIQFGQKLSWEVIEGRISDKHAAMIGQQCLQWCNQNMDQDNQKIMDRLDSRESVSIAKNQEPFLNISFLNKSPIYPNQTKDSCKVL